MNGACRYEYQSSMLHDMARQNEQKGRADTTNTTALPARYATTTDLPYRSKCYHMPNQQSS